MIKCYVALSNPLCNHWCTCSKIKNLYVSLNFLDSYQVWHFWSKFPGSSLKFQLGEKKKKTPRSEISFLIFVSGSDYSLFNCNNVEHLMLCQFAGYLRAVLSIKLLIQKQMDFRLKNQKEIHKTECILIYVYTNLNCLTF